MKTNIILKHSLLLFAYMFFVMQSVMATKTIDTGLDVGTIDGAHSVNLSGAFTYTIPIKIPEGTMGMQPNLSLNYNSPGLIRVFIMMERWMRQMQLIQMHYL